MAARAVAWGAVAREAETVAAKVAVVKAVVRVGVKGVVKAGAVMAEGVRGLPANQNADMKGYCFTTDTTVATADIPDLVRM